MPHPPDSHWIDIVNTDFNRPPRDGVYFCRAFSYEDGTGSPTVGQAVFICDGGDVSDGTPGLLGIIRKVNPEVKEFTQTHQNGTWTDWYRYVEVEPIDWRKGSA